MAKSIPIDCIELKNSLQAELRQEYAGLSMGEEHLARRHKLMTSDSLAAQIWRNAQDQRKNVMAVHEESGTYTTRKKRIPLNKRPE